VEHHKKHRWYWFDACVETKKDVGIVGAITGGVSCMMATLLSWHYGFTRTDELAELIFIGIGGAVIGLFVEFGIRLLLITPAKMRKDIQQKLEEAESKLQQMLVAKPIGIESLRSKDSEARNCEVVVHNPNQGVSGVGLRLLKIEPPLLSRTGGISTEQVCLSSIQFSSKDVLGDLLKQNQTARFDILIVKRGVFEISVEFAGQLPSDTRWNSWLNDFLPEVVGHEKVMSPVFREYILTFETSAVGVPTQETQFRLSFSIDHMKPAFELFKGGTPTDGLSDDKTPEQIRIIGTVEYRKGPKTFNCWNAFCPQCHMPLAISPSYEGNAAFCSTHCGWDMAPTAEEIEEAIKRLSKQDQKR